MNQTTSSMGDVRFMPGRYKLLSTEILLKKGVHHYDNTFFMFVRKHI